MSRQPNILVINPDQMRADALHHLGCAAAYTPNLDALAAQGVSFQNAFCQNPVCAPSRCSFMTGLYPHTCGHRTMSYLLRPGEPNLFELLKKNGYYVWASGRGDCLAGQYPKWLRQCTDKIYNKCGREKISDQGRGKPGTPRYRSFYRGAIDTKTPGGDCADNDWAWTHGCAQMIRRHKGERPFFAFLGLMDPHPPYRAEQKYLDRIDEGKLSPPIPPAAPDAGKPKMEYALRESLNLEDWGRTHFAALRKTYLAMCARVDEQIGTVVQALKDSGQYDNTAIFIFSDHGDFTGDYGLVEKAQNLFPDCLTRVPLLIKPPAGVPVQPGINPQLTELIDFYATALDFAGVESDHTHFGRSLLPTLADRRVPVRDFVCCEGGRLMNEQHCTEEVESYFGIKADDYAPRITVQQRPTGEHTKAAMLRTKDYKYVLRLEEEDEFYVLPDENRNRIHDPAYQDTIAAMQQQMLRWYMETCDRVPTDADARFPDDYYLETVNALTGVPLSPLIKGVMKLTGKDFTSLVNGALRAFHIDTNKFYKY